MFIKILVLYLLLLYTPSFSAILKQQQALTIIKQCAKHNNVTEEEYDQPEIFLLMTPTENQLCMVKCVMEHLDMIDSDGTLQKSIISDYISAFNRDIQEEIILCAEKVKRVYSCYDLERYRKCLEPNFYNE